MYNVKRGIRSLHVFRLSLLASLFSSHGRSANHGARTLNILKSSIKKGDKG